MFSVASTWYFMVFTQPPHAQASIRSDSVSQLIDGVGIVTLDLLQTLVLWLMALGRANGAGHAKCLAWLLTQALHCHVRCVL
jgi:hypothetical protein